MSTPIHIEDPNDPRVAPYAGLRDAHLARANPADPDRPGGLFIAEGHAVVRTLLASRFETISVLTSENRLHTIENDVPEGTPLYVMPLGSMSKLAGFDIHRGVLAVGQRTPEPTLEELAKNATCIVAIEGLSNHDNVGAIFRNAAALGGAQPRILLDATSCDPLYRKSIRVSMGHALRIPFARTPDLPGDLRQLTALGFETIALETAEDAVALEAFAPATRRVLVLGAEGPGITEPVLDAAQHIAHIPMTLGVPSLNVATAGAIALHRLIARDNTPR